MIPPPNTLEAEQCRIRIHCLLTSIYRPLWQVRWSGFAATFVCGDYFFLEALLALDGSAPDFWGLYES